MDIVEQVKRQEVEERGRPFIAVRSFTTELIRKDDGTFVEEDFVEWVKKGQTIQDVWRSTIRRMPKDYSIEWTLIEPAYKAWKAKEETPDDGSISLRAWGGLPNSYVDALKSVNIRTIDDFCDMEDSALSKLGIPNIRAKRRECHMFREAQKNSAPQAAKLAKMEEENELLRSRLDEQAKQIEQLVAATEKRGPGRPRKEVEAA
jgi:hypothetical protein